MLTGLLRRLRDHLRGDGATCGLSDLDGDCQAS